MNNNEINHINLLGHKRTKDDQLSTSETKLNKERTPKENKTEFQKFIVLNKHEKNGNNGHNDYNNNDIDNPFHDLYENPNLKIFNDIDTNKKRTNNKIIKSNNNKIKNIFKNIPSSLNGPNINFDFLNFLNQLFFPQINYNILFNESKNIFNLNASDCYKNNKIKEIKSNNINQINSSYHPIFNYSNNLYNSLLNNTEGIFTKKNINKENNEKNEQINKEKNVTIIEKKDLDEIVQKTNYLFNKLSDIRVGRNVNLYKNN